MKMEHDFDKLKTLVGVFAQKNAKGDFFLRNDFMNKLVSMGCHHSHSEGKAWHSYEVVYDLNKKLDGVHGYPLQLLWAGFYKINDWLSLKSKMDIKREVNFSFSWIQQFDKNCRFIWTDNFNMSKLCCEDRKCGYNYGAMFEWKL